MLNLLGFINLNQPARIHLVNDMDVNIEHNIPTERVIAKPLIGPAPKIYNNSAANKVVILESNIVEKAIL